MNFKRIKKGIVIATLVGTIFVPSVQGLAANELGLLPISKKEMKTQPDSNCILNAVAELQKQSVAESTIKIESSEEIQFNDKMSAKVFVTIEGEYLYILTEATEDSDWTGKVFDNSVVRIAERGESFSKIQSGNVEGYVRTESLVTGKDVVLKAKAILEAAYPDRDVFSLSDEEMETCFSVGETKEEETARLAAEEAARIAEEQARIAAEKEARRQRGKSVVDYAKRFIGNPYVYGGTSLTRGTDCSGFVKGVYAHFGVSLPRTSYAMRKVGYAVSYSEIQPGDIVCYSGHVGIYAGDGKIINAIDESRGIGLSNARYRSIITVRRIF